MCKKLRKTLLKNGYVKVEMKMQYTTKLIKKSGEEDKEITLPLTYKYPMDSFQRAYRNIKKSCKRGY